MAFELVPSFLFLNFWRAAESSGPGFLGDLPKNVKKSSRGRCEVYRFLGVGASEYGGSMSYFLSG